MVKPCPGILLSPDFEKHVAIHGPFQLYTDLLEVDTESLVLVLAALRDSNIIKLYPQKRQQNGTENEVILLTQVFSIDAEKQQLKITIDSKFVKKILKSNPRNLKINVDALDLRKTSFCYFTVDDLNRLKYNDTKGKKQKENVKSQNFELEFPGEKIDFLKNYDEHMQQKFKTNLMSGVYKLQLDQKSIPDGNASAGRSQFYDLAGHKHVVHDESRHLKKEKESKKWWNRLSEAKVREVVVEASTLVQDVLADESVPEAVSKIETQ